MKEMEQLYRRHKDELYRYLLALTGDREAAGDLSAGDARHRAVSG